jgi:hypothetical protein
MSIRIAEPDLHARVKRLMAEHHPELHHWGVTVSVLVSDKPPTNRNRTLHNLRLPERGTILNRMMMQSQSAPLLWLLSPTLLVSHFVGRDGSLSRCFEDLRERGDGFVSR